MKTIHAVYENGVFRPTEPVDLPEGSAVLVEPTTDGVRQPQPSDPEFAHMDPGLAKIYAILSHRYDGGSPDASARHNEHQP
ncbi:antitoxin family protein [Aquisphaera insulae]|uniref:antitoxin family protein n=1 Tax=Aquisphaera insulae TaxID=2712864 RepID=UPI0013EB213D|nr:antitoxin family protein [Aquisphaera insulae]